MNVQMDAPLTSSTESHLQCATAELTVSRHVVVSKWSQSLWSGWSILSGLHLCVRRRPQVLRFQIFAIVVFTSIAQISTTCCPLLSVACEANVAATSEVLLPG